MTTEVLRIYWPFGLRRPLDRAMSNESATIGEFGQDATSSVSIDRASEDSAESLFEVFKEASHANWDGYGARGVSDATLAQALSFLALLPSTFPKPEFSAHPNGELAFEWFVSPRHMLTVSVNEWGRLIYAALIGQRRQHGTELLLDALPDTIVSAIRELGSHDQAKV